MTTRNFAGHMIKSVFEQLLPMLFFYESDKIRKLKSIVLGIVDYKRGILGKKDF